MPKAFALIAVTQSNRLKTLRASIRDVCGRKQSCGHTKNCNNRIIPLTETLYDILLPIGGKQLACLSRSGLDLIGDYQYYRKLMATIQAGCSFSKINVLTGSKRCIGNVLSITVDRRLSAQLFILLSREHFNAGNYLSNCAE